MSNREDNNNNNNNNGVKLKKTNLDLEWRIARKVSQRSRMKIEKRKAKNEKRKTKNKNTMRWEVVE